MIGNQFEQGNPQALPSCRQEGGAGLLLPPIPHEAIGHAVAQQKGRFREHMVLVGGVFRGEPFLTGGEEGRQSRQPKEGSRRGFHGETKIFQAGVSLHEKG